MEAIRTLLKRGKSECEKRLALIDRGSKRLNFIDKAGNSLAHWAVIEDRLDLLERFKLQALRLNVKNEAHLEPLDLALYLGRRDIAEFLGYKARQTIQIFRNRDGKLHDIAISELEKKLNFTFTDHLEFTSYSEFLVAQKRAKRVLRSNTYRKMNEWVLSMHGAALWQRPHFDNIYIRHIDKRLGYGVFAAKRIPALSYLGEYTGVVKRRPFWRTELGDYVFAYHAAKKNIRFIIDGQKKGNFTRFINHSEEGNVLSRWVVHRGIGKIIFFTKRVIEPHEQLTYDYGDYFWRKREVPKPL